MTPTDLSDVPAELREAVGAALAAAGMEDGHLGVEIVGEGKMRALNFAHRGVDEATDVLAFPLDGTAGVAGPRELGDVFLCLTKVERRDRGGSPWHASPLRLRPRDRRGRDAGAAGESDGIPAVRLR